MFIDTHCHINSLSKIDRQDVLAYCSKDYLLIDSSIDLKSVEESLKLSLGNAFVFSSVGFHPFSAEQFDKSLISKYQEILNNNQKIVAIGEIGLDYKAPTPLEIQEDIFVSFIKLALNNNLPIAIHNRTQDLKILDILDEHYSTYSKVIFHCFSSQLSVLERVIKKDAFVSFSLNLIRKKKDILESLKACPIDNLLLETDSPYMRINERNSTSKDINSLYEFVSSYKGIELTVLKQAVFNNVKKAFSLLDLRRSNA